MLDRLQGLDNAGQAGLEDVVDRHWGRILAGVAVSTLMGVGAELAAPQRGSGGSRVIIAAQDAVQDTANEVGKHLTKKNLDLQPTITLRPGFELRVMVNQDIVLQPYQPLFSTGKDHDR